MGECARCKELEAKLAEAERERRGEQVFDRLLRTADERWAKLVAALGATESRKEALSTKITAFAQLHGIDSGPGTPKQSPCDEDECSFCSILLCPHNDPMHLHHDGCPAEDLHHTPTGECSDRCRAALAARNEGW